MKLISGLYFRFLTRKILHAGILKNKSTRLGIAAVLGTFMVMVGFMSYYMLGNLRGPLADVILDSYGISGMLVSSLIFIVVTLIFSKSTQLQELTLQLPVTNRHRAVAMAVFEVAMLFAGLAIFFGPYFVALCWRTGSGFVGRSLLACLFPSVCSFFVYAVVYASAERLLGWLPARWRSLALEALLAVGFMGVYRWQARSIDDLGRNFIDGDHRFIVSRSFVMLADRMNAAVAVGAWALAIVVCCVVYVLIVPDAVVRDFRYIKVPVVRLGPRRWQANSRSDAHPTGSWTADSADTASFGRVRRRSNLALARGYLIRSIRAYETSQAFIMAIALYALLAAYRNVPPVYAADIMLVASLFAYVDTEPLRSLEIFGHRPSLRTSARHYALILVGQLVPSLCVLLAMCVSEALLTRSVAWRTDGIVLGILVASTLLFVLVGVLFPPHRDNPFSVGISLAVVTALVVVSAASIEALRIPLWGQVLCGVCAVGVCLYFSIYGIYVNERNTRNEISD